MPILNKILIGSSPGWDSRDRVYTVHSYGLVEPSHQIQLRGGRFSVSEKIQLQIHCIIKFVKAELPPNFSSPSRTHPNRSLHSLSTLAPKIPTCAPSPAIYLSDSPSRICTSPDRDDMRPRPYTFQGVVGRMHKTLTQQPTHLYAMAPGSP